MKRIRTFLFASMIAASPLAMAKPPAVKAQAKTPEPEKVNILTADAEHLALFPGVGPKLAEHIVEVVKTHPDQIKTCDDLGKIKGVGAKLLSKILPFCTVEGETTLEVEIGKDGKVKAKKTNAKL